MKSRKQIYSEAIFKYGYLPLLVLIETNEQVGNYEECAIIKEAIKEYHSKYGMNAPTNDTVHYAMEIQKEIIENK